MICMAPLRGRGAPAVAQGVSMSPATLLADGTWTYFTRPEATYKDGWYYFGWCNSSGQAGVTRLQVSAGSATNIQSVTLASLGEARDNETGNHIIRTQHYVKLLAQKLQTHPRFSHYLNDATVELLFKSAPLHDIGKIGIPDSVLLKPSKLTAAEFEVMKTHTTLGKLAIESAETRLGKHVPFLRCAKEIAYSHQEKWDGSGYPEGLAGDAIPVSARLMAIADVYDALISRRVYKPPFAHEVAMAIIQEGRGIHFDPDVTDTFTELHLDFKEIAQQHADVEEGFTETP